MKLWSHRSLTQYWTFGMHFASPPHDRWIPQFFFSPLFSHRGSGWSYWKGRVVGVMQQDVLNTTESPKFQPSCDFCICGKLAPSDRSPFNSADARQYAGGRSCSVFIYSCTYIWVTLSYVFSAHLRPAAHGHGHAVFFWFDLTMTWLDLIAELSWLRGLIVFMELANMVGTPQLMGWGAGKWE